MLRTISLLAISGLTAALAAAESAPRLVASRDVVLSYNVVNSAPVESVRLWTSTNCGREWSEQADVAAADGRIRFTAPGDGRYDFFIVLENAAGASADPPTPGTRPHGSVIVDTTPPLLQVHEATYEPTPRLLKIRISLIEENLRDSSARVFYRFSPTELWQDGGAVEVQEDMAEWRMPAFSQTEFEIKVLAADRAGNRAASIAHQVKLPSAEPEPAPAPPIVTTPEPTKAAAAAELSELQDKVEKLSEEVEALRSMAKRYLSEGRYNLAEARLEDALKSAPDNPGLLMDMGSLMMRVRQFDKAEKRFEHVLEKDPNHTDAIYSLAVVAQAEKRYPEARKYLKRLEELRPESGQIWLRVGDNHHALGNGREAADAWRRVLEIEPESSSLRAKAKRRLELFASDPNKAGTHATNDTSKQQQRTADHRDSRRRGVS